VEPRRRLERLERQVERELERREDQGPIPADEALDLEELQLELEDLTATFGEADEPAFSERRRAQQTAVREVSRFARERRDTREVMQEVCRRTAATLGVPLAGGFRLRPEEGDLLLHQGVGWPPGMTGEVSLDAAEGTQGGHTVDRWDPTVVDDVRTEERFAPPGAIDHVDVRSGVTVVVPAPERAWGILGVYAAASHAFDPKDVVFIQSMAGILSQRIESQRARGSLAEETGRFASLVLQVEDYAIFDMDPEGHVRSWNRGAERIKGYDEEEIVGRHFSTFYTEEDRAAGVPERNLERAAAQGSVEDEGWRSANRSSNATTARSGSTASPARARASTSRCRALDPRQPDHARHRRLPPSPRAVSLSRGREGRIAKATKGL
jgi:PAS domain S-box-containing protein